MRMTSPDSLTIKLREFSPVFGSNTSIFFAVVVAFQIKDLDTEFFQTRMKSLKGIFQQLL